MKKLKSIEDFQKENSALKLGGMGNIFGGKKIETVYVTDKLNDYYEDTNNNGKQDRDECLVFVAPPKKTVSQN